MPSISITLVLVMGFDRWISEVFGLLSGVAISYEMNRIRERCGLCVHLRLIQLVATLLGCCTRLELRDVVFMNERKGEK